MVRCIVLLLIILAVPSSIHAQVEAAGAPPAIPWSIRSSQVAPEDEAPLAFDDSSGHIFFRVKIGDQERWGTLDTGATGSLMDVELARELGLAFAGKGSTVSVPNGGVLASFTVGDFSVLLPGEMTITYKRITAVDLRAVRTPTEERVAFVLGRDLLDEFFFLIDSEQKVLRFGRTGNFRAPSAYQAVRLHNGEPLVEISVNDQTMLAMIDTGKAGELDVQPQFWGRYVPGNLPVESTLSGAADGSFRGSRKVSLPNVGFGSFTLSDIDLTERQTMASWGQGSIGMGILGRFRIVIDTRAQMMWVAPRLSNADAPADSG